MARNILLHSSHPTFGPSCIMPSSGKTMMDNITLRWVQQFMEVQGIVCRVQCGKLQVSDEKIEVIERATAYHMGQVARGFASGELDEDLLENMDETHFIINMDNGKTLGFRGDTEVRYADVVSGGLGITMVVKVTGGKAAKICTPMLIFQNCKSSYPIRGTPDTIPGVHYWSSPSNFMTSALMSEYYSEPRVSWADPTRKSKIQFIDNCPGHNEIPSTIAALARIRTKIQYFPTNSTHLTQPCDSFVISKIKDAWRRRWDQKKMDMIGAHMWQGDGRDGTSSALQNPGWTYYLQLAADSVRDHVNGQVDRHYGMTYARKAMIQCGLSLNLDGTWDVKQLTPQLQRVISKYHANFEGSLEGLAPESVTRRTRRVNSVSAARPSRGPNGGRGRARIVQTLAAGSDSNAEVPATQDEVSTLVECAGGANIADVDQNLMESQISSVECAPASAAGPSPAIDDILGVSIAVNWAATRPGACLHRKAARRRGTLLGSAYHGSDTSQAATTVE